MLNDRLISDNLELERMDDIEWGNISIPVDGTQDDCIEGFEQRLMSKSWYLDSQKNAQEYYSSTGVPQLKVFMLAALSPTMTFNVTDDQARD